jgi:hypothetical protein
MKKLILLFVLATTLTGFKSFSQNPIPSYNFLVQQRANFQEDQSSGLSLGDNCLEKRQLIVRPSSGPSGAITCSCTVWVYSHDKQTVLGPFTVHCGDLLVVEIDEREWGTYIQSDQDVYVDVWIE